MIINTITNEINTKTRNKIDTKNKPQKTDKEFKDPLLRWPIRGMAFSNDIGAAIMDIAPKTGMIFWIPALMYFGADIYDKYKNDQVSYDPNAKRGLKQALFQTFASIVFPIIAVHAGQKTVSLLGLLGKSGLSLQTRNEVIEHQLNFMAHKKLREYDLNTYKEQYGKELDNYLDEITRENKFKNPIKFSINLLFGHKHPEHICQKRRKKIHDYINKRIDNIYINREKLLQNQKPTMVSKKMFTKLQTLKEFYKKDPSLADNYNTKAVKYILKDIERNKILKIKLLKTLGGFISLGIFIKPIDKFVENIIIEKFVEPKLDKFNTYQLNDIKNKLNFKSSND